jgi:hypothetical protein
VRTPVPPATQLPGKRQAARNALAYLEKFARFHSAESGTRTRTPYPGIGFKDRRVCQFRHLGRRPFKLLVAGAIPFVACGMSQRKAEQIS